MSILMVWFVNLRACVSIYAHAHATQPSTVNILKLWHLASYVSLILSFGFFLLLLNVKQITFFLLFLCVNLYGIFSHQSYVVYVQYFIHLLNVHRFIVLENVIQQNCNFVVLDYIPLLLCFFEFFLIGFFLFKTSWQKLWSWSQFFWF